MLSIAWHQETGGSTTIGWLNLQPELKILNEETITGGGLWGDGRAEKAVEKAERSAKALRKSLILALPSPRKAPGGHNASATLCRALLGSQRVAHSSESDTQRASWRANQKHENDSAAR